MDAQGIGPGNASWIMIIVTFVLNSGHVASSLSALRQMIVYTF
jgi:hypothetical protein